MIEATGRGMAKAAACAVAAVILGATGVEAAVITAQGTWYGDGTNGTLLGRDINGNHVPLLDASGTAPNPAVVFLYDTERDLVWLNLSSTAPEYPGDKNWQDAMDWAAALDFGGYNDWRLPAMPAPLVGPTPMVCTGFFCLPGTPISAITPGSEIAYLWYNTLGNEQGPYGGQGQPTANTGPFQSLQPYWYWSSATGSPALDQQDYRWFFNTGIGQQNLGYMTESFNVLVVRSGDVTAAAVPEPGSLMLALSGLTVLWRARRRRRPT